MAEPIVDETQDGFAASEADFFVLAAHPLADEAHGFTAGVTHVFAVGVAEEFFPAFGLVEGHGAKGFAIHLQRLRCVFPVDALGTEFGSLKERILEKCDSRGEVVRLSDHGMFLPVASKCTYV